MNQTTNETIKQLCHNFIDKGLDQTIPAIITAASLTGGPIAGVSATLALIILKVMTNKFLPTDIDKAKKLDDIFKGIQKQQKRSELDHSTQISQLTKIINIDLKQDNIYDAIEQLGREIESSNTTLEKLSCSISLNNQYIEKAREKFMSNHDVYINLLYGIQTQIEDVSIKIDQLSAKNQEFDEKFDKFSDELQANMKNGFQALMETPQSSATNTDTKFSSRLKEGLNYIKNHDINQGIKILDEIEKKYIDDISSEEIINLYTQRGLAKILGELTQEGCLDIEKAISISEVIGKKISPNIELIFAQYYLIKNQKEKALEISLRIKKQTNSSEIPNAIIIWILSSDDNIDNILDSLSCDENNNSSIIRACAYKAYNESDFWRAASLMEKSISLNDNPAPLDYAFVGSSLVIAKFGEMVKPGFSAPAVQPDSWKEYIQIEESYIRALITAEKKYSGDIVARQAINLALLYMITGNHLKVNTTLKKLKNYQICMPSVIQSTLHINSFLERKYRVDGLILFEKNILLIKNNIQLLLMFVNDLLTTGTPQNVATALEILNEKIEAINEFDEFDKFRLLTLLGRALIQGNEQNQLATLFEKFQKGKDNFAINCIKIWHAEYEKNNEISKKLLSENLCSLPNDNELKKLYFNNNLDLYYKYDLDKELLDILEPLIDYQTVDPITSYYIDIAIKYQEYKRIVKVCAKLRTHNLYDWQVVEAEIFATQHLSNLKTEDLLQELSSIPAFEEHKQELLTRYYVQKASRNYIDFTYEDFKGYPSVDEIDDPILGYNITKLLLNLDKTEEGLNYAYLLYQKFPNVKEAHRVLFDIMILNRNINFLTPQKVEIDCAVTFSVDDEIQTVVIENTKYSSSARNEISPEDTISKKLLGLRKAEEFIFQEGIVDKTGMVIEIKDKRLFRAQECLKQHPLKYPEDRLWPIKVIDKNGEVDFSILNDMLKKTRLSQEADIQNAIDLSNKYPPIPALATVVNLGLLKTLYLCRSTNSISLLCTDGTQAHLNSVFELLKDSEKEIIISPVTSRILLLLQQRFDIISILERSNFKFVISEYLLENWIDEFGREMNEYKPNGTIHWDGRLIFTPPDTNGLQKERKAIKRVYNFLFKSDYVKLIPGNLSIELFDRNKNNKYIIGRDSFHSYQLASQAGKYHLWDDDLNGIRFCNQCFDEIKINSYIFTQAFALFFVQNNLLNSNNMDRVYLFQLEYNFYYTYVNGNILYKCFSNYSKNKEYCQRILSNFEKVNFNNHSIVLVTASCLAKIWTSNKKIKYKRRVSRIFIEKFDEYHSILLGLYIGVYLEYNKKTAYRKYSKFFVKNFNTSIIKDLLLPTK